MASLPPSGVFAYPDAEPDGQGSLAFSVKPSAADMRQKMLRQRQISLERSRDANRSTLAPSVRAQDLPMHISYAGAPNMFGNSFKASLGETCNGEVDACAKNELSSFHSPDAKSVAQNIPDAQPTQQADPRPSSAASNFTSLELESSDGGQQQILERPSLVSQDLPRRANEATTWDLSVGPAPAEINAGEKKWWKPTMPFRRGASASPSPAPAAGDVIESVVSFDRAGMGTPDSTDRTFHGPNRRPAPKSYRSPGPAANERRSLNRSPVDDFMPGGVLDRAAEMGSPADNGRKNGGHSPPKRGHSPPQARSTPVGGLLLDPSPGGGASKCGVSAYNAARPPRAPMAVETEVCAFQAGSPEPESDKEQDASSFERKRGGKRSWRPWKSSNRPDEI